MSSTFHCQNCASVTDVSNLLMAFEGHPHCPTCGLSVSESDAKMQDELSHMMSRNLHLNTIAVPVHDVSMPPTPEVVPQPAPIAYITQHYHHSSHQVPTPATSDLPASTILRDAGVDPTALFPSQLQLFKNAQPDQQQRLIELWKIAPPTYGNPMMKKDLGNWPQTSFEQEEDAARERWCVQEQDRLKNLRVLSSQDSIAHAEPYMTDGYQGLPNVNGVTAPLEYGSAGPDQWPAYKPSTDPAYTSREWWHMTADEPMEHQYGMLQQIQMQMNYHNKTVDRDERMW